MAEFSCLGGLGIDGWKRSRIPSSPPAHLREPALNSEPSSSVFAELLRSLVTGSFSPGKKEKHSPLAAAFGEEEARPPADLGAGGARGAAYLRCHSPLALAGVARTQPLLPSPPAASTGSSTVAGSPPASQLPFLLPSLSCSSSYQRCCWLHIDLVQRELGKGLSRYGKESGGHGRTAVWEVDGCW